MKLSTSTNIAFERADGSRIETKKSIEMCAKAGYTEMDLCFIDLITVETPFTTDKWKEYIIELKDYAKDLGISFTQGHSTIHDFCNDNQSIYFSYEYAKRCIEAASMLGIKWLVMHPSTKVVDGQYSEDTHDENVQYFKHLGGYAETFHVGIAIENMWGLTSEGIKRYAIDPSELRLLVDDVNLDNVGACWDTQHGAIENIDQGAALRTLKETLKALHISDMTSEKHVHILPYVGFIDWEPIYEALVDINYEGSFAFEMQHYLLRTPYELIQQAINMSHDVGEYMLQRIKDKKRDRNIL